MNVKAFYLCHRVILVQILFIFKYIIYKIVNNNPPHFVSFSLLYKQQNFKSLALFNKPVILSFMHNIETNRKVYYVVYNTLPFYKMENTCLFPWPIK